MLLSLFFSHSLPLSFRWEEAVGMAAAVVLTLFVVRDGRTSRRDGLVLVIAYAFVVAGFLFAGNR
jgi:Ca2+/H+ antiporter